jgi:phenylalanyl-tRNA synthetase beta chain
LCGGSVSLGTVDVRTPAKQQTVLDLRDARVEQILGLAVPASETENLLRSLGCEVTRSDQAFKVGVPSFRADLEREIDLIEEVARIYGLDKIPETLPGRRSGRGALNRRQTLTRKVEDLLQGAGLMQVLNYSFTDQRWPDTLRLEADDSRRGGVAISNPLSADQSIMRTMLLPGLLATAQRNVSVREEQVPIFEIGRVYLTGGEQLPQEPARVGILVAGEWATHSWLKAGIENGYFLVKGLLDRLSVGLHTPMKFSRTSEPFLHPGRSALLQDSAGRPLGWIGEVHPLVAQAYDLRGPVTAAELDLDGLLAATPEVVEFRDLLAYPEVEQDVALVVDAALPAATVMESLRRAGGPLLEDVSVFDLYEGAQVGQGKKSIALRLSFRSAERTLSEDEVNKLRGEMLKKVSAETGAELRG